MDVGCGVGGAARYFAAKYGSQCIGINISPHQTERAKIVTAEEGLADKVCLNDYMLLSIEKENDV